MEQKRLTAEERHPWSAPAIDELMRRMSCTFLRTADVTMVQTKGLDWEAAVLHYKSQVGGRDALVYLGSVGWGNFEAICDFKLFFFDGSRGIPKRLPYDKAKRCFVNWNWTSRGDVYNVNLRSVTWTQGG
jgi:hypothetical protein